MDGRVEQEGERIGKAEILLKQLEERENAIIERLKHTQRHENRAKQMLVEAIMSTTKGKKTRVLEGNMSLGVE